MGGAVSPQSESAERSFAGGTGTADDPYQIATAEQLKEFAKLVNDDGKTDASAVLTDDIDLNPDMKIDEDGTVTNGDKLAQWTPIGTSINQYRGTFNGAGHTISGLYINDRSADYQGLFGYVSTGGIVKDLSVSGTVSGVSTVGGIAGQNNGNVINCAFSGSVSGSDRVGGVVGYNNSSVENCYNTGTVTGPDSVIGSYVGGVVGYNNSNVENCYNTGTVTGSDSALGGVGGVVGYNNDGASVENCYNTGDISGGVSGGVVGQNSGTVKNCYNTSSVKGDWYVGGVVGYNNDSVKNCYNTGKVTGTRIDDYVGGVGGVVGYNISGTVENCYFLSSTAASGIGNGGGGATPLSAEAFESQKSFANWTDFDNTWEIKSIFGRPTLQANAEIGGTANNPYKIFTATQLKNFATAVNSGEKSAHAKLMNDIDLKDVCGKDAGESEEEVSWEPIGNSIGNSYEGTFNGDGHTISGLYIAGDDDAQGLFGYVSGTVQNLTVDGTVSGDWHVGGVVGYNSSGTVTNCAFSGTVTGSYSVGGVVGENSGSNGSVEKCHNTGSVNGSGYYVGGVVGWNSGIVENCYNTDSVSGGYSVGGVVGYNNGGTVKNCYNTGTGTVTGTVDYVGGVVGDNFGGTVENCYNTGSVKGPDSVSGSYVGGVVGDNSGTVENCYNTGKVTGSTASSNVGGVVGFNSGPVKNCYNTGTVSDGTISGGVVGENFGSGSVTNCYFLPTADVNKNLSGIGLGGEGQEAIQKTADEFRSGEVACLLQGTQTTPVWGQSALGTEDSLPTLVALDKDAKPVYKVAFISDNTEIEAQYANSGMTVGSPTTNPTKEGYTFAGWFTKSSGGSQWNFNDPVNKSMTLYAQWTAVEDPTPDPTPDPEPEEPPYTGKYSYEISTDASDNGAISVDRYATEGDKVTIDVTPDQAYKLDDLTVTAHGKDVELTANSDGTYSFTMPSADVRITATFAEDPDWTEPEEPATDVSDLFIDIAPDAWYKDAVQYAYDNGLMTGVSATEFAPEATTTRAMIVSILARLEGVTTAEAAGFADVNDNDWYATAVNWAANVGVVNGYEDNTFRPNTAITREQLAAILMNYAAYKGEDVSNRADLTSYTDQPSTWAEEAMQWAVAEGLISGVTNDQLQPQSSATRAQVAAILQRLLEA